MQSIQNYKAFLFLLLLLSGTLFTLRAKAQNTQTQKEATQWVQSGAWRNGLQADPHSSINEVTFQKQYNAHPDWWNKAFAFLNRKDLVTLADGTYPIVDDQVFASISSYVPVNRKDKQWEAHRKYADIQMVLSGKEIIGKAEVSKLKVIKPYNKETDNENLKGQGKFYLAKPGTFFIFFPGDAHLPGLKVSDDDNQTVKKIVIKVRVS